MRNKAAVLLAVLFLAAGVSAQTTEYEQYLAPFDTVQLPGSHGAVWSAELLVRNGAGTAVNLFPETCHTLGRPFPCDRRIDVAPGETRVVDVLSYVSAQQPGVFLYVPATHAGKVQFNLRVREVNLANDAVGTDVQVVRRSEYRTGSTTFIGIPLGKNLRPTLRVYLPNLSDLLSTFVVRVYREPENELVAEREYSIRLPTDPPSPVLVPMTGDFSEALALAAEAGAHRVTVTVERTFPAQSPYWPLLSVTSNDTNRVTVFHAN